MKQAQQSARDRLILELGDMVPSTEPTAELKRDVYTAALPYMGYDAAGVGEMEAYALKESGGSTLSNAGVPQICANLIDAGTDRPLVDRDFIIKTMPSGLRVGIIAVLGDNLVNPYSQDKDAIRVLPPAETLRETISKLNRKVDLVTVLAHTNYDEAKKLASAVPGIDIMLSGHRSPVLGDLERVGRTVFMHCRARGKYVGKMVLDIDAQGKITAASGEYVPMSKEIQDDLEMTKLLTKYDQEFQEFYRVKREGGLRPPVVPPAARREPKRFVSHLGCRRCHDKEFRSWAETPHLKAFDSLRKDGRTSDPECLSCHTTGYKSRGGYTSEGTARYFPSVQCEACHGPGADHAEKPAKGYGLVQESTCTECHDAAHSPNFDYKQYLNRIQHKGK